MSKIFHMFQGEESLTFVLSVADANELIANIKIAAEMRDSDFSVTVKGKWDEA